MIASIPTPSRAPTQQRLLPRPRSPHRPLPSPHRHRLLFYILRPSFRPKRCSPLFSLFFVPCSLGSHLRFPRWATSLLRIEAVGWGLVLVLGGMLCSRMVMNFILRKDVRGFHKGKDGDPGDRGHPYPSSPPPNATICFVITLIVYRSALFMIKIAVALSDPADSQYLFCVYLYLVFSLDWWEAIRQWYIGKIRQ